MSLRDGRSFKEAAKGVKFRDGDISYVGHGGGKMLDVGEPSGKGKSQISSPIQSSIGGEDQQVAFKSPKKRIREEFEEREANSETSLEVIGVFDPTSNTITP